LNAIDKLVAIAPVRRQTQRALLILRTAADREDAIERDPVVPGPIISARELLGEMLLRATSLSKHGWRLPQTLKEEPGRFWSLDGAARAVARAGNAAAAKSFYAQLVAQATRAKGDRPALKAAKQFLEAK
jgi:hypothetical protein